ncbi:MAG: hypothetical protein BGO43_12710 [Gammaproteobacteria bacterium 39-13]|nr:BON domain-containing protein [Gammaproteobacteria bacterium]OJV90005.1 MAG: hypothetical protein BGO43_12710 [Gammaproteobacteria bacterium 39-13]
MCKKLTLLLSASLIFCSQYTWAVNEGSAVSTTNATTTTTTTSNLDTADTVSDAGITAKVKEAFLKEKLFGNTDVSAMSIHVETKNGMVSLTGTAENQNQIDNAIRLATDVKGVQSVSSEVKIKANQ